MDDFSRPRSSKKKTSKAAPKKSAKAKPAKKSAKPAAKKSAKPAPKKNSKPAPKTSAMPAAKKSAKPAAKKSAKPAAKTSARPAPKKSARPAPKKSANPAAKKTSKPAPKKSAKPAPKKSAKPAPKKSAKPAPKKSAKPAPKKSAKPAPTPRTPETQRQDPAPSRNATKDGATVTASAKGVVVPRTERPMGVSEDELSPVRSSKTSGPLMRVTSALARPPVPLDGLRTEPLMVPAGELVGARVAGPGPVVGGPPRLPPEVRPDPSILSIDENRGALSAHGYRLILLHPESLIEIQMALEEKIGLEAGQILFRGGYRIGLREARRLKDTEMEEEEIVKAVANRCSAHGWGIFTIEGLDLWRHELTFKVEHSPFAYAYGKSSTGVDHLIRGVFSGVCEVIFDKKVVATEAQCRAMGDPVCQFLVG